MGAIQNGKRILRGLLYFLGAYALLVATWMGLSLFLKPAYFALLGVPFDTNKLLAGAAVGLAFGLALRPALGLRLGNLASIAAGLTVALIAINVGNPSSLSVAVGLLVAVDLMIGGILGALAAWILRSVYGLFNRGKVEPPSPS